MAVGRDRRGRVSWQALAGCAVLVLPGLALLHDATWLALGAVGLLIGLPLGALPMLLFLASCLAAGSFIAWKIVGQGERLLALLGVGMASAARLRPAVHAVALTLVGLGLFGATVLWPDATDVPDRPPLCQTADAARAAIATGSALMGHGQRRPMPECRALMRPDLAFLLPPWLGVALAASLLAARARLEREAADAARRRDRAASSGRGPTAPDVRDPAPPLDQPAEPG